ncbi:hypothetical protein [Mariniplasma anaerobium]|uniref:Uncharacterized protein n=1 Tax=Mariniplasma anaerobium TaxID=2735436 RepID=A0A7U9TJ94_9MOLU|nr:hypothetical protein [Mariniplasma anaerobium]BCR35741.1 hypothetical protein MPAN_006340 [Mariniplasma anaerobium]
MTRKVTLERKKSFVASIMKVYVYVQSGEPYDLKLDGVPLRLIDPPLKNGQSITFDVPTYDAYVYVVFDKHFPKKYNAKFLLKAGQESVKLYTKPRLNPFKGNPFSIFQ